MSKRNWIIGALAALGIAGLANAQTVSQVVNTVAVGGITGLGTGVATALGINVGSAGSPVVNGGALGTPSSGVGTNITGLNADNLSGGTVAVARGGVPQTAFSTYTPTIGCGAGTITTQTSTGRYQQFGKFINLTIDITITSLGTCTGLLSASIPIAQHASDKRACSAVNNTDDALIVAKIIGTLFIITTPAAKEYIISCTYEAS